MEKLTELLRWATVFLLSLCVTSDKLLEIYKKLKCTKENLKDRKSVV